MEKALLIFIAIHVVIINFSIHYYGGGGGK